MKPVRCQTLRSGLLALALLVGSAGAVTVKVRPQGPEVTRAVQEALNAISTKDSSVRLDTDGGAVLTLGGSGATAVPFNPDAAWRTVKVGNDRRIEFNPQGPVPLAQAVREALATELGLKEWTAAAARVRLSGADLNGDGSIDLTDLALLMKNYGQSATVGDLNGDRKVDDADVGLFGAQYRP
ncbi:hypothetical protein [Deinococcus hopiensis]|uniref:EF-hand domain-containing protein n=1 Tax=Deinococcus hopiensis KR-140 TaxID=695939 RepID=A0A1W1VMU9_9DEIO|nr:hypothetical protein [Deinococcus hopiensis]SMB94715.1 hypothetical protein SAMN00790413_02499 [Deinococcus hopiensis KR-140]